MSNEVTAEENEVWLCGGDRVERVTDLCLVCGGPGVKICRECDAQRLRRPEWNGTSC